MAASTIALLTKALFTTTNNRRNPDCRARQSALVHRRTRTGSSIILGKARLKARQKLEGKGNIEALWHLHLQPFSHRPGGIREVT